MKRWHRMQRVISVSVAIFSVAMFLASNMDVAQAATYTFTQNSWAGGATSNTAVHPTNENGWNQYQSSSGIAASSTIQLGTASATTYQTSNTDFNAGTFSNVTTTGSGASASVKLVNNVVAPNRVDYAVGTEPEAVAFDSSTNSMWVANYYSGTVSKINVTTGASSTYSIGTYPSGIAFDPVTDSIWTANSVTTVSKINVLTGTSTAYNIGTYPSGITFDPVTDSIWTANSGAGTVSKINIITGTSTAYTVGAGPNAVAFDPITDSIWTANSGTSTVSKVNIFTGTSTAYNVGNHPYGVAFDSVTDSIWATNYNSGTVSKVNIFTGTSTAYNVGSPQGIAFDPVTNSIWVTNYSASTVSKVNITTGTSTAYAVGGSGSDAVAFDPVTNSIWVANYYGNNVSKIAVNPSKTIYTVGSYPGYAAYDPIDNFVWVTNQNSAYATKINLRSGTSSNYGLPVAGSSYGIVFDPTNSAMWIAGATASTDLKINLLTGATTSISNSSFAPGGAVFDPVTNSVWVAAAGSAGSVEKINSITGTSTVYGTGATYSNNVAFDPITNSVWSANYGSVTKINIYTGATTTYSMSSNDYGIAFDPTTNSMWVAAQTGGILKVNVTTGSSTLYSAVAIDSGGVVFDPITNSILLTDYLNNIVTKLNPANGQILGYFYTLGHPFYPIVETSTNSLWIPDNASGTVEQIPIATYVASGTYTSAALNAQAQSWGTISWDNSGGQTITMKARSANNAAMTGATAWASCGNIASGGSLTGGGCVNNGDQYIQYQATLSTANTSQSPSLDDVTVAYTALSASGTLVSSPYDSGSSANLMGSLAWTEGTLPASTTVTVSLRTATTSALLASSTWTTFTDVTANCTKASGVVTCSNAAMPSSMENPTGNEWFQYQVALATPNGGTPTVSSVVVQYVVNAPPQFNPAIGGGTGVAVGELNGTSTSAGWVQFQFSALDPDANTDGAAGGHATSTVTPTYQYSLNGGTTWSAMNTFITPNATSDITMATGTYSPTSTIVWNAAADLGSQYTTNAEIRVTLDDHQIANNTATATSTAFALDTKPPLQSSLNMDASKGTINFNFSDNSNFSYRLSSNLFTTGTPTSTLPFVAVNGNATSVSNYSFAFVSTSSPAVYAEVEDIYGNDAYQSYIGPTVPTGLSVKDISNRQTGVYGVYLSWATSGIANFKQYDIFRSTGGTFTQIGDNPNVASTSYADYGLSSSTVYYYEIKVEDTLGDISAFTPPLFITPTGNGGGPAISSVSANPSDTNAIITWNTNILPQSSYVYYSTSPSMAAPVSIVAAVATSGPPFVNTANLINLTPSSTYYFYVQSTDSQGDTTIDNNNGVYYNFQATNGQAPVISSIQVTPTENSADIRWTTNKPSNSAVFYGISSGHESLSVSSTVGLTTNPEVLLTGLTASTTYYYYLYSADSLGHATTTAEAYFTTSQFAPVISNIANSAITTSTATISWTTDKLSNSFVFYSATTTPSSFVGVSGNSSTTAHVVTLTGLTPTTTYYYYVQSTDPSGDIGTDNNNGMYYSVKTAADTAPPIIANIQTPSLGQTVATITWTTNKAASSQVFYGTSSVAYASSSAPDGTMLTAHSVSLNNLAAATPYYFVVSSTDQYGNHATSSQQTFSTLTLPGPQISGVASTTSDFAATITWTTNSLSDSKVYYGTSTSSFTQYSVNSSLVTAHAVSLAGLSPGTHYYFYVQSTDANNNTTNDNQGGQYYALTTTATQPPTITAVTAGNLTIASATITWNTNISANAAVYFATSTAAVASGTPVTNASLVTSHTIALGNLAAGTTYYYAVQSIDAFGNATLDTNSGAYYSFATLPAAASITGTAATSTPSSFTATWTTTIPANSYVYYSTATSTMGSAGAAGNNMQTTSHSVTVPNLAASTTYYFYVKSTDTNGNTATDTNGGAYYAVTTLPGIAISDVTASPADTNALVSWDTQVDADSFVFYGTATSSLNTSVGSSTLASGSGAPYAHSILLGGLTPSTTYYFYVQSTDANGNVMVDNNNGNDYSFVTTYSEPPVMSNVNVFYLTGDTAGVSWTTDKMTDSEVYYGTASGEESSSTASSTMATSHQIFIEGLTPETTYYYVVRSADPLGNAASSTELTFTTQTPVFADVTTTYVGDTEAIVAWTTTMDSNSYVHYFDPVAGGSDSIGVGTSTLVGGSAPFQHSVEIDNLNPATTYEYYLESDDADGNTHIDDNYKNYYTFTTTDHRPPVITNIGTPVVSQTAAIITWLTDKLSTSQVDWGDDAGIYTTSTDIDDTLTTYHAVPISGLTASSTYHFRVRSKTSVGSESFSGDNSLDTLALDQEVQYLSAAGGGVYYPTPNTTPPKITAVTATTTPFDATINFVTDEPAIGFVEYGASTSDYSYAAADGAFNKIHTITAKGLVMGTTYHFYVKAIDQSGNVASTTDQTFTTQYLTEATLPASTTFANAYEFQQEIENSIASALPSLVPPFLGTPVVSDITQSGATVSWTTNINSYSIVYYAADADYDSTAQTPYPSQTSDVNTKVTSHSLSLTGLQPNTLYHIMAESFSIPGVFGKSSDITFTTSASTVTAQISNASTTSFRVSWTSDEPTNSIVQYRDAKTGVTQTITDDTMTTVHAVDVENLMPAHTYQVTASGDTATGNVVAAANAMTVTTTKDTTPPVISNIKIQTIIDPQSPNVAQAIVAWTTDKPANSVVQYDQGVGGPTSTFAHTLQDLTSFVTNHVAIVPNLTPGSVYRVQISSTDEASNTTAFPPQTIIVSQQSQSILDVILGNFENTFQFMQNIQK